jgi:hypothetical protein
MRTPLLLITMTVATVAHAGDRWESDYRQLQKWQFTTEAVPIVKPVTLVRDTASWTLRSGKVRLMEPAANGRCTGLIFEGDGQFTMTVPDAVELAQLRRFALRPQLRAIDTPFTEMVLRVSDETIDRLFAGGARPPFASQALAEKRHNHWLIDLRMDVDAAIVAAMANGDVAMTASMRTADFDWLTWDYDGTRREEIQLIRWWRQFPEVWLSLDRAEDRQPNGRPGADRGRPARLDAIDVKADLTRYSLTAPVGETRQRKVKGHYRVEETITMLRDGLSALRLQLEPTAWNLTARDDRGDALSVVRDHIGARSASLDDKIYDQVLTLFFPAPPQRGEQRRIVFDYDLETENYAPGRSWYPTFPEAFDAHTARLDLLVNKRNEIRAMGELKSETETDRGKRSVWVVSKPAVMITFSTAEHFEEASVRLPDQPEIISFGDVARLNAGTRVRNAAVDVANSVQFFQNILAEKLDTPRLYVTSITSDHGQAFDGFLHLSEWSYSGQPGAEEMFRAHETAHEWFGHKVGWKSYRDQWLTESFAEYAAMMFVQSTVKDGTRHFNEILDAYEGVLKANMLGGFSKFSRPWLARMLRNSAFRQRLGPIDLGYRAGTGELPFGYMVQTYYKGPLVLHMLRSLLRYKTQSDDLFIRVLRDFVHQYSGKQASTADFQRVLEGDAPGDWSWFVHAWIESAEMPTLTWSYKVEPSGSSYKLSVTVKRSGVGDDFSLIAPVRLEFDGNRSAMMFVPVNSAEQTVSQSIDARPRAVVFAPDHSLLANIRRE